MDRPTSTPAALFRLGRYRLLRRLGRGGMATVYHAVQEGPHGFENEVAVKLLHPELLESAPHVVQMLVDEARIASRVRHPNVVRILDLCDEGNHVYLVMDYVDGVSLRDVLDRCRESGQPPPVRPLLDVLAGACEGLHAAHRTTRFDGSPLGLVHRDVKPGNILVGAFGEVKVADFGVARFDDRFVESTVQGQMKGTPAYMSPEQVLGRDLDGRADIFSMGVTLYTLCTTKLAFTADTPVGVALKLAHDSMDPHARELDVLLPGLGDVLRRACQKEPDARFGNASEMAQALRELAPQGGGVVRDLVELGGWRPWKPDMVAFADEPSLEISGPHRSSSFNRPAPSPVRGEVVASAATTEASVPDDADTFDEIDRTEGGDDGGRTDPGGPEADVDDLLLDELSQGAAGSAPPARARVVEQSPAPPAALLLAVAGPERSADRSADESPTTTCPTTPGLVTGGKGPVIDLVPDGPGIFGPVSVEAVADRAVPHADGTAVPLVEAVREPPSTGSSGPSGPTAEVAVFATGPFGAGGGPSQQRPTGRGAGPIAPPIPQPWARPGGGAHRRGVPGPIPGLGAGAHGIPGPLPAAAPPARDSAAAKAARGKGGSRKARELDYRGRVVHAEDDGQSGPSWVDKAMIVGGLVVLAAILWLVWQREEAPAPEELPPAQPGSLLPEPTPPPDLEPLRPGAATAHTAAPPLAPDAPAPPEPTPSATPSEPAPPATTSAGAPSPTSLKSTNDAAAAAAALFPSTQKAAAGTRAEAPPKEKPPAAAKDGPRPSAPAREGTLVVNSYPWATVLVDGVEVGKTPITGRAFPVGQHMVELRFADGRTHKETVTIFSGEETKVVKKLPAAPPAPTPEAP